MIRVTTQMLQTSAIKAGMPIHQNSLLNYINDEDNYQNTLLNALDKNSGIGSVSSTSKASYEKLGKSAEELEELTEAFMAEGKDSIFELEETDENKQKVYETVEELLSKYNETIKNLGKASNVLNEYYKKALMQAASENKDSLESIGISIDKNGSLSVDEEKLKGAGNSKLKEILGSSGDFMSKISFVASRIADNANANAQSVSSQYDAAGSMYAASMNRYDFWG